MSSDTEASSWCAGKCGTGTAQLAAGWSSPWPDRTDASASSVYI